MAAALCCATVFSASARGQEGGAVAAPQAPTEPPGSAPAAGPRTVWDNVYTDAQATRGKDAYSADCAACHSDDLGGSGYAPALKGDDFTFTWNEKSVGDFFERVRRLMPPDNPGSLPAERYRDITAYILSENKYPSGTTDLPADAAVLKQIKIAAKP